MPRILSISSSRADVGVLDPVWSALAADGTVDLHVLATGMHRSKDAPDLPLPSNATLHIGGEDMAGRAAGAAALAMANSARAIAELLERDAYDCILLMGDRLDMLPAAFAALPFNVPLAHLHGGETTYGAVDERIRHALTKLAHLHFVSSVDAAERVVQMGEEPWRVTVTGAPGLDTLQRAPVLSPIEFSQSLDLPFTEKFWLVTVHPETNAADSMAPMRSVLGALDNCKCRALITAPNSDPGGRELRVAIGAFLSGHPQVVFRESLGSALYPNALRHARGMLGNSSSGLIEAGFFGLPVINVGARQQGRPAGPNVCHVGNDADEISSKILSTESSQLRYAHYSPYGDGCSGERIARLLANLPAREKMLFKVFHDARVAPRFMAPWDAPSRAQSKQSCAP